MDLGHQLTDEELAKLERKIAKVYKTAADEMQDKITEYFKKFDEQDKKKRELLEQGKITEQEYKQWRLGKLATGKKYQSMRDQLAERMTNANQEAVAYVNSSTPTVYSLNRNYTAYQIEQADINASFQLWDESTVARLIKDNPELMPNYPKEKALARGIDLDWGKKQISKEITTGILLGESNQRIAKRLLTELPDMNKASAIRTARTATTSAENGGRLDTFKQAEQMGIPIKKQWVATHDGRTREEHILADGQIVGVDEPFIVGGEELMKPGDDSGSGWNIYNCRCRMYSIVKGRVLYNPDTDANYQKWLEAKQQSKEQKTNVKWEYVEKQEQASMPQFTPAKTIDEAQQYAERFVTDFKTKFSGKIDYKGIELDYANEMNRALTEVFGTFKPTDKLNNLTPFNTREARFKNTTAEAAYQWGTGDMFFNKAYYKTKKVFQAHQKEAEDLLNTILPDVDILIDKYKGQTGGLASKQLRYIEALKATKRSNVYAPDAYGSMVHELGHFLDDTTLRKAMKETSFSLSDSFSKFSGKISAYATSSEQEYIAESFAAYWKGEKDILDPALVKLFERLKK